MIIYSLSGKKLADVPGDNLADANLADANLAGANLEDANLEDANLADANLAEANLEGANLKDANLEDANLVCANLKDANLAGANLAGANLVCANLKDANLKGAKIDLGTIDKYQEWSGRYKYNCGAGILDDGTEFVRMGCFWKTVAEWESIGILKSNLNEFPNDGSERSTKRAEAYEFCKAEAKKMKESQK